MSGYRETIIQLASDAVSDPAHAQSYAQTILSQIAEWRANEGDARAPTGYLYAGAHTWIARQRNLAVEILPEEAEANNLPPAVGVQIFESGNQNSVDIRTPFDGFIYAVTGAATIIPQEEGESEFLIFSTSTDGRDLFSVEWGLDGQVTFVTDGFRRLMFPAAVSVGDRLVPRSMAWTLRRNQTINVRFRNLINAFLPRLESIEDESRPLLDCQIEFHVINVDSP